MIHTKTSSFDTHNSQGFSIIEVLIGVFIFSLGLVSIYAVIDSTLKLTGYNKNYIIATNLAREQLELIRNIRDVNYEKTQRYNQVDPSQLYNLSSLFLAGKYYTIENNYSVTAQFPIEVSDISTWFEEWEDKLSQMQNYRLCIDSDSRYVLCSGGGDETPFYRYIYIEDIAGLTDAIKITSKVIWYQSWYHEFEVKTILADWRRL